MLINCTCAICANSLGIVQYTDHYFCQNHYGEYVCIECHKKGTNECEKCQKSLSFHDADETKRFQRDNNILF
jgi:hypothetical protein